MIARKPLAAVAGLALLSSCTQAQLDQAAAYQAQIATACNIAMALLPQSGPVAPWIRSGCSTQDMIAKLARDPSSKAWLDELILKARGRA